MKALLCLAVRLTSLAARLAMFHLLCVPFLAAEGLGCLGCRSAAGCLQSLLQLGAATKTGLLPNTRMPISQGNELLSH